MQAWNILVLGFFLFDGENLILSLAVWQRLRRLLKSPEYLWAVWGFGILAGALIPLLLVMVGWLIELLLLGQNQLATNAVVRIPDSLVLGPYFELPTSLLNSGGSILRGVLGLIVLLTMVVALECIALLTCYRAALHCSLDIAVDVQRKLFDKSTLLAMEKGLSGQKEAIQDMVYMHVPQVRESVHQWYRVFPRHPVQTLLLIGLAASIQPVVTLLGLLAAVLLWFLFGYLDSARRKRRPVLYERARASSEQLAYFCETAPLLASVHDHEGTRLSFERQLETYRQSQTQLADGGVWKSPTMLFSATVLSAFFLIVVSIRFLDDADTLHFGEVFTLFASVTLAMVGMQRFIRAFRRYRSAESAAQALVAYLEQTSPNPVAAASVNRVASLKQIQLEHLTVRDTSGQKLLEDITATIRSGQLTAIVASEPVQASALAELVFGFGRPASGRILFDGLDSTDLDPQGLREASLWVAANGPLIHGSLEENLWAGIAPDATIDLMGLAKKMHAADAILNLPDNLATLVSPTEDRMQPDDLFRLGLTRALIKKPKLILAEEPSRRVNSRVETETSEALLHVRKPGVTVVILAKRLSTLRSADQILVLHDRKLAGAGTHSELLESSEIYRHLNYLQFSSFVESDQPG